MRLRFLFCENCERSIIILACLSRRSLREAEGDLDHLDRRGRLKGLMECHKEITPVQLLLVREGLGVERVEGGCAWRVGVEMEGKRSVGVRAKR